MRVVYEQAEDGGWGTYLPDVPWVVAVGASRDEVTSGIREALDAYVEGLTERGLSLPEPHHAVGTVAG